MTTVLFWHVHSFDQYLELVQAINIFFTLLINFVYVWCDLCPNSFHFYCLLVIASMHLFCCNILVDNWICFRLQLPLSGVCMCHFINLCHDQHAIFNFNRHIHLVNLLIVLNIINLYKLFYAYHIKFSSRRLWIHSLSKIIKSLDFFSKN